jgi:hypothetical protein
MIRGLLFPLLPFVCLGIPCTREVPLAPENPRTYEALRAPHEIAVDGSLDDSSWAAAPWTEDFVDILGGDAPPPPLRTRAKLLWDDEYLYVGAEMEEPHLWATLLERDAIIYQDDDLEVFLDPNGDGLGYFEIEVNALGTVLDLFMNKPYGQGGTAEIAWSAQGLRVGVLLMGTLNRPLDEDRGWSVEMAIPWAELVDSDHDRRDASAETSPATQGHPPNPGDTWRLNFSRVDWPLDVVGGTYQKATEPSRENRHPEANWVWSSQGSINMHIPEKWGFLRFMPAGQDPHGPAQFPDQ